MSDLTTIRQAIVATLQSVPGIGQVHAFERFARQEAAFRNLYLTGDGILGWNVSRKATRTTSNVVGRDAVTHEWQIRGFMALNDAEASELAFDDLIEAARREFRTNETLSGTVFDTALGGDAGHIAGLQVLESGPVMFCGVLCHGARLQLFTRHYQ